MREGSGLEDKENERDEDKQKGKINIDQFTVAVPKLGAEWAECLPQSQNTPASSLPMHPLVGSRVEMKKHFNVRQSRVLIPPPLLPERCLQK